MSNIIFESIPLKQNLKSNLKKSKVLIKHSSLEKDMWSKISLLKVWESDIKKDVHSWVLMTQQIKITKVL